MAADIGLWGLAVMGENLVLNMASKGFAVAVYNRTAERTRAFVAGAARGKRITPAYEVARFVAELSRPRKIMLMVKAGPAVDEVIEQLLPLLEPGDLLIDGGNSYFADTIRRSRAVEARGFRYIGTGVSGGEEGALKGPSIMPGGSREAYDLIAPIFTRIAAQVDGTPCCTWIGENGAGHFVKMVHNGIEYGDMQLIAEAYALLAGGLGLSAGEMQPIFAEWNRGELDSYLIEITAEILGKVDPETGRPMVDVILDKAGQKGTGVWTSQTALALGVPTPTITEAVYARAVSALKEERVQAAEILRGPRAKFTGDRDKFIAAIHDALYASKICSYAQGFCLMQAAGREHGWSLRPGEIAMIWRGGCIIRARFLQKIKEAYDRRPDLPNRLLDKFFREVAQRNQVNWRKVVMTAARLGIPVPGFGSALAYFDSYRRRRLSANLLQAQRDYFGAHTYQRVDKEGIFHTDWLKK